MQGNHEKTNKRSSSDLSIGYKRFVQHYTELRLRNYCANPQRAWSQACNVRSPAMQQWQTWQYHESPHNSLITQALASRSLCTSLHCWKPGLAQVISHLLLCKWEIRHANADSCKSAFGHQSSHFSDTDLFICLFSGAGGLGLPGTFLGIFQRLPKSETSHILPEKYNSVHRTKAHSHMNPNLTL